MGKTSPIKLLLTEMLKKNEIVDSQTPKQVRAMRTEFQNVKDATFRTYLSEAKEITSKKEGRWEA